MEKIYKNNVIYQNSIIEKCASSHNDQVKAVLESFGYKKKFTTTKKNLTYI